MTMERSKPAKLFTIVGFLTEKLHWDICMEHSTGDRASDKVITTGIESVS
jgi:hypothetical protein